MKRVLSLALLLSLLCVFFAGCEGAQSQTDSVPTAVTLPEKTEDHQTPSATQTPETPSDEPDTTLQDTEAGVEMKLDGDGVAAVWWWDKGKTGRAVRDEYLDFLEKNSINEIYLCWPNFAEANLASFVKAAGERGMRVSLLSGDAYWIYPENSGVQSVISRYLEYQKNATPETRLASLHLDVEPHQLEEYGQNRDTLIQYYADFVISTSKAVRSQGERLEWDIPFWFDGFEVTNEKGEKEALLELLARNSDTLCLMSYRDTATAVVECALKELELGKRFGCRIVLGVETHSEEGDHVSFMEEGREYMHRECEKLYGDLKSRLGEDKYGIAIHYLDTWYKLKD